MDGTQVAILEKAHEESLTRLLQRKDSRSLKPQISLEPLRKLANEALERKPATVPQLIHGTQRQLNLDKNYRKERLLAKEKLSFLLVHANLTQSQSARTVSLLSTLLGLLRIDLCIDSLCRMLCQGFARRLTASVLARSDFAACHSNGAVAKSSRGILLFRNHQSN
jgi:hypothetical protein